MIKQLTVSCSQLEDVKEHLDSYVATIKSGNRQIRRPGMLSNFQSAVESVLAGRQTILQAKKMLENQLSGYAQNNKNKKRINQFIEAFLQFFKEYEKLKMAVADSHRYIRMPLAPNIILTGLTPMVLHNDNGYYSYILTEKPIDWQTHLRFPIYQHYIANNTINCEIKEVFVGVYCVATNKFEFRNFSKREIENTLSETKGIVSNLEKLINGKK